MLLWRKTLSLQFWRISLYQLNFWILNITLQNFWRNFDVHNIFILWIIVMVLEKNQPVQYVLFVTYLMLLKIYSNGICFLGMMELFSFLSGFCCLCQSTKCMPKNNGTSTILGQLHRKMVCVNQRGRLHLWAKDPLGAGCQLRPRYST